MLLQPRVRIRAGLEERAHRLEIGRALVQVSGRLRIERRRGPMQVQDGVERRRARGARDIRIRPALQKVEGHVPVPIDRGHEHGRGVIAGAGLVDVRTGLEQHLGHSAAPLPGGQVEGAVSAVIADQLRVAER